MLFGLQPRVDSRDLGHLRELVLHAGDLLLHDVEKAPPLAGILDLPEHLGGRSDRGERVLQLVGDVRGEGLQGSQPLLEPSGQLL